MDQIPMKNQVFRPSNTQSGSIFVWIFVMIALFGALSFAMMQTSRSGAGSISKEKAKLIASEIIDYGTKIGDAVKILRIDHDCSENQLGFDNSEWMKHSGSLLNAPNHNPSSPSDGKCKIFSPAGGGLRTLTFEDNGVPASPGITKSGHLWFARLHVDGVGDTGNEDLVLWLSYVDRNVCNEINALLGVENPGGDAPTDLPTGDAYSYDGSFDNSSGHMAVSGPLYSKRAFCYRWTSGTPHPHDPYDYHYIQVLLAR